MKFYSTLSPGLEDIAANELESLGAKILEKREGKGRIFLEGNLELIAKINYFSRTIERLNILLHREVLEDISLDEIYKRVYEINWEDWIKEEQSFAVRPLRVGEHNFTSIDIGRVAGEAVIKRYLSEKGVRLKVNLDEPDIIVRVELIFNELLVAIDTTGDEGLHKRGYRVYNHPAHLNATIAASLIYLSGWKDEEFLLDPMCGSGTIPIEGALIKRNIPIGKFRERRYGFSFVKIFGHELLDKIKNCYNENYRSYKIVGMDINSEYLEGAKKNAINANVIDTVKFLNGSAEELDKFFNSLDVIVTNPPYGIRMGKKRLIGKLYNNFLSSAKNLMHGDSRIVVITAESKLFKDAVIKNNFNIIKHFDVMFGGLLTKVYYIKL
ncbi:RNA methylase [Methanocaldococcus villosus KIN24-T80]|uniref:RNA methylase n=1 Tax=Methanocaldococcus villosus KIN24-T80 TaxID=1069083 RepID=N6VSZ0_9EURY|nr:tRNA (guanine(6)-N2)-methyltransferase [Methanocaldococcus villosus]ENN96316.1 RNA methylase [Methanocaldococcus villosus KIN24-T80]